MRKCQHFASNNHVGNGLDRHCLLGSESISDATSADVVGDKRLYIYECFVTHYAKLRDIGEIS